MTQTEMLEYLEQLRLAYQRFRSITAESGINDNEWIYGDKCPLRSIQMVLDRGYVEKMEFYNFLYVFHYFTPEVMSATDAKFPEPALEMLL